MKTYPNLLTQHSISSADITRRIHDAFDTIFRKDGQKFYFPLGDDAGFLMDTGNMDARTEGISYGMMMCVQLNEKALFDKLWQFADRYMRQREGKYAGYFAWSVRPDGVKNAQGPAPDGEEYFAMALFFASHRWGDAEPPFDYGVQARAILRHCLHQPQLAKGGEPMWDPATALIKFTPEASFSDPSYHLPHFYQLFALWADEADRPFWARAAEASRAYIKRACHPITGLSPEYAHFDGRPETDHGHGDFYSDAYRVAMNIGLDSAWNGPRPEYTAIADRLQAFFIGRAPYRVYAIDGTPHNQPALHPLAVTATTAAASLATDSDLSRRWIRQFWDSPMRTGDRRYYDNCLYFFCLLMLAGEYRIY